VEDCACGFGFSCTEDNDTFSCIDDPYYELKLVIPGTYQQLGATQLTNTIANDTAGYGCNGVLFSLEGTPWCIELQPTMLLSTCKGSPIGDKCQYEIPRTGKIWFDCANLGNEFGAQIKDWCDGLGSNYNCSSGVEQCGSTGIRVEMCNDEWAPGCWDDGGVGAAYLKLSSETE
jgi:hypothetical protein